MTLPNPKSRKEQYLAKAAGMSTTIPEKPESREEQYLEAIANNGGGGGGGTKDFDQLDNRPKYKNITMDSTTNIPEVKTYTAGTNITIDASNKISATDTTYDDFVGTDGTSAGTAGLVPAPATTDTGKFLKSDGTWDTAGGGSSTLYDTPGTNTDGAMTQKATTSMVFADPADRYRVQIGNSASASSGATVAIGSHAVVGSANSIAIGAFASIPASIRQHSVALGDHSIVTASGEVSIGGSTLGTNGYNGSQYRLLTNLYDGQGLHDAATVAQGNTLATSAPTTSTEGVLGQLYTDTTNMHTYQCTAIDTTDPSNPVYTWVQRW